MVYSRGLVYQAKGRILALWGRRLLYYRRCKKAAFGGFGSFGQMVPFITLENSLLRRKLSDG